MVWYVIPARAGSKGFPGKNRVLAPVLRSALKKKIQYRTIVTTDDDAVVDLFRDTPVKIVHRPSALAEDDTPIRPVLRHVVSEMALYDSDDIVLLYPTYPGRRWPDIKAALHWYQQREASSMLCAQPATPETPTHLAVDVDPDLHTATSPTGDGAYRRQDADGVLADEGVDHCEVSELSHYVAAFSVGVLDALGSNLRGADTMYYDLDRRVIDVDTEDDWNRYLKQSEDSQ